MIRRPKATDTEEDLLSLQESFLASGELPSASFHSEQASASKKKVQVGEKRRDHGDDTSTTGVLLERDVVKLHPQGVCTLLFSTFAKILVDTSCPNSITVYCLIHM